MSRRIIVPKGLIQNDVTVVIEIPEELADESDLIASPASSSTDNTENHKIQCKSAGSNLQRSQNSPLSANINTQTFFNNKPTSSPPNININNNYKRDNHQTQTTSDINYEQQNQQPFIRKRRSRSSVSERRYKDNLNGLQAFQGRPTSNQQKFFNLTAAFNVVENSGYQPEINPSSSVMSQQEKITQNFQERRRYSDEGTSPSFGIHRNQSATLNWMPNNKNLTSNQNQWTSMVNNQENPNFTSYSNEESRNKHVSTEFSTQFTQLNGQRFSESNTLPPQCNKTSSGQNWIPPNASYPVTLKPSSNRFYFDKQSGGRLSPKRSRTPPSNETQEWVPSFPADSLTPIRPRNNEQQWFPMMNQDNLISKQIPENASSQWVLNEKNNQQSQQHMATSTSYSSNHERNDLMTMSNRDNSPMLPSFCVDDAVIQETAACKLDSNENNHRNQLNQWLLNDRGGSSMVSQQMVTSTSHSTINNQRNNNQYILNEKAGTSMIPQPSFQQMATSASHSIVNQQRNDYILNGRDSSSFSHMATSTSPMNEMINNQRDRCILINGRDDSSIVSSPYQQMTPSSSKLTSSQPMATSISHLSVDNQNTQWIPMSNRGGPSMTPSFCSYQPVATSTSHSYASSNDSNQRQALSQWCNQINSATSCQITNSANSMSNCIHPLLTSQRSSSSSKKRGESHSADRRSRSKHSFQPPLTAVIEDESAVEQEILPGSYLGGVGGVSTQMSLQSLCGHFLEKKLSQDQRKIDVVRNGVNLTSIVAPQLDLNCQQTNHKQSVNVYSSLTSTDGPRLNLNQNPNSNHCRLGSAYLESAYEDINASKWNSDIADNYESSCCTENVSTFDAVNTK